MAWMQRRGRGHVRVRREGEAVAGCSGVTTDSSCGGGPLPGVNEEPRPRNGERERTTVVEARHRSRGLAWGRRRVGRE